VGRRGTSARYDRWLPLSGRPPVPWPAVSTRRLIIAALLCGLAILVAFSVQLLLVL
jgi:hypothetical protein